MASDSADEAKQRRGRTRALLRRPGYRQLWVARTVSQRGDAFNTVALTLLVVDRGGAVADRARPRQLAP